MRPRKSGTEERYQARPANSRLSNTAAMRQVPIGRSRADHHPPAASPPGPSQRQGRRAVRGRSASGPGEGPAPRLGNQEARACWKPKGPGRPLGALKNCNGRGSRPPPPTSSGTIARGHTAPAAACRSCHASRVSATSWHTTARLVSLSYAVALGPPALGYFPGWL